MNSANDFDLPPSYTLVQEFLPAACADGNDVVARSQMMVASTLGATAFQKGLGAMHSLTHAAGG